MHPGFRQRPDQEGERQYGLLDGFPIVTVPLWVLFNSFLILVFLAGREILALVLDVGLMAVAVVVGLVARRRWPGQWRALRVAAWFGLFLTLGMCSGV